MDSKHQESEKCKTLIIPQKQVVTYPSIISASHPGFTEARLEQKREAICMERTRSKPCPDLNSLMDGPHQRNVT